MATFTSHFTQMHRDASASANRSFIAQERFFLLPVIIFFEHLSHATIVFCHAFKMTQKMKQYMYVLMSCRKKVFPVPSAEGMAMLISEMLQYKILSAWQCTCF